MRRVLPAVGVGAAAVALYAGLSHQRESEETAAMASALRAKHAAATVARAGRTAIVVGATSGIGEACALRLAEAGMKVVAVGRDRARGAAVVEAMAERGGSGHEFISCDSFSLASATRCAAHIRAEHPAIDVLVMSQGMATIQGFTPTVDGNDEKLTLHYWSRMA